MFTDPPRLVERIARRIDDTTLADPNCLIRLDQPCCSSLTQLFEYSPLVKALIAAGMPADLLSSNADSLDKAIAVIPYLKRVRNCSQAWKLYRILNDLYDFTETEITESNVRTLNDRIIELSIRPGWANEILAEKSHLSCIANDLTNRSNGVNPATAEDQLNIPTRYRLNLTPLLYLEHAAKGASKHVTKPQFLHNLENTTGSKAFSNKQLQETIHHWLGEMVSGQVRFTFVEVSNRLKIKSPLESEVNHLLERAAGDIHLTDDETDILINAASWHVMSWHNDHGKSIVFNGLGRSPHQSLACPAALGRIAGTFPKARIILSDFSKSFAEHASFLAARHSNLFVSGLSSNSNVIENISSEVQSRIQITPGFKFGVFSSNATSAEWVYGNLQLLRRGLARAITSMIENDYLHENQVPELLELLLYRGPMSFYGLD